jgi:hypothetical protein
MTSFVILWSNKLCFGFQCSYNAIANIRDKVLATYLIALVTQCHCSEMYCHELVGSLAYEKDAGFGLFTGFICFAHNSWLQFSLAPSPHIAAHKTTHWMFKFCCPSPILCYRFPTAHFPSLGSQNVPSPQPQLAPRHTLKSSSFWNCRSTAFICH